MGTEPVHAVHDLGGFESCQRLWIELVRRVLGVGLSYYGVAEGSWGDSADHFVELVGVDTETVEGSRPGEFAMGSV